MALPNTITADTLARAAQVQENFEYLETEVFGRIRYLGAWNNAASYLAHDAVDSGGSMWVALLPNVNVTPVEGATWHKIASSATVSDASTTVKGISKLSTAPASSSNPIAVGDNDTRMTNARTPTGSAGGVLSGTYPNPGFAADMATQAELDAHTGAAAPHSGHLKTDGSNAMAAALDAGGFKVVNLATPTTGTDAVTKTYADALATGISLKASVKVATTANITLSGAQTIDSVSVVAGDRVLVKNQTTGSENGIYVAASGSWSRSTDADSSGEMPAGTSTFVEFGSTHQKQRWTMITPSITLGTTAQEWTQDSSTGTSGSTSANGNSEGVGVWDSLSGTIDYFRGIASTNSFITVALNAGTKSIRLTLNEALLTLNNLLGTLLATKGGTGQSTTTLGDLLYGAAANTWNKLTGNTTTTAKYLRQTGDGVDSAAPEWTAIDAADLPIAQPSGAGHAPGAVPDTPATPGISKYLCEDMTFRDPSIAAGAGDMAKSVYDTDNDGIVDNAEALNGHADTYFQTADADLTAIAGLTPTNDDVIQRKAGAWTNRTPAQLKTDLAIAESDVSGLVSDLAAKAPLASPTFTGIPAVPTASAGTNTTQAASTAFVTAAVAAGGGGGGGTAINEVWLLGG